MQRTFQIIQKLSSAVFFYKKIQQDLLPQIRLSNQFMINTFKEKNN